MKIHREIIYVVQWQNRDSYHDVDSWYSKSFAIKAFHRRHQGSEQPCRLIRRETTVKETVLKGSK